MRFGILGPLEVSDDGQRLSVGGPQQRALLSVLLLNAGRVVSSDRLVGCLWGEQPPVAARSLLQGCVAGLRRALAGGHSPDRQLLLTRAPGYSLELQPDELDLDRFEQLVREASRSAAVRSRVAWEQSAGLLAQALSLWRGPVLDGVALDDCQADVARLEERRLEVLEQRTDAELRLGRHAGLVGELESLVRTHPLRERLWAQLMLALYGADRQADALASYQRLRWTLVEQLGIEPSATLRHLQGAILSGADPDQIYRSDDEAAPSDAGAVKPIGKSQPTSHSVPGQRLPADAGLTGRGQLELDGLDSDEAVTPVSRNDGAQRVQVGPGGSTVPRQLPPVASGFTGRVRELAHLDDLLGADPARPTAVVVSAVSGTAGVGKTALAVHWAHRVADRFPDGQLYVNLYGFDPARPPMEPEEAVRGFLDALEVPVQRIPTGLDAQVGLYRSLLADKRVLVVLDNARDAVQVRPLLPGASGCLALVTSRNHLTSLVAVEGAHPLGLDLLTEAESRDLLTHRLGAGRTSAEPDAVEQIIVSCARLPLALAIVAARAATRARFSLATIAREVRESAGSLDALHGGDPATDIRAVFSWSCDALTPGGARLFRLIGLHPGPDISAAAAASLAGIPSWQASQVLAELTSAHLVAERAPGRYAFHDLLRAYAAEQACVHETDDDRHAALHRVLDHYLYTVQAAVRLLYRQWTLVALDPAQPGVTPEEPTDKQHALAWLTAEHRVLLTAIERAATAGFEGHAWRLANSLTNYLQQRSHWHDWAAALQLGLHAAQRTEDPDGQAHTHSSLGSVLTYLGRYDEAQAHLQESLTWFEAVGDKVGQARVHGNIGILLDQRGDAGHPGLHHDLLAFELFRSVGHRAGQAIALNNIGWDHAEMGNYDRTLVVCQQALDLLRDAGGDRQAEAGTWDTLGYAHHHLGQHGQAVTCYIRATELYRDLGDRYYVAATLIHLGDTNHAAGDPDTSRHTWQRALRILEELDHPDAEQVRTRLHGGLNRGPSPAG